jgi:hypothetical protein
MTVTATSRIASIVLLLTVAGCSRPEAAATLTMPEAGVSAATQQDVARTACVMVTAVEMASIVGATVSAEGENGADTTTCRYRPAAGSSPYVEIRIDWGAADAAMMGAGLLARREPGISNRLAGVGDDASGAGPVLMVRVGEDLVNLTLWGVDDDGPAARRIIGLLRPRMGPSASRRECGSRERASGSCTPDS